MLVFQKSVTVLGSPEEVSSVKRSGKKQSHPTPETFEEEADELPFKIVDDSSERDSEQLEKINLENISVDCHVQIKYASKQRLKLLKKLTLIESNVSEAPFYKFQKG